MIERRERESLFGSEALIWNGANSSHIQSSLCTYYASGGDKDCKDLKINSLLENVKIFAILYINTHCIAGKDRREQKL